LFIVFCSDGTLGNSRFIWDRSGCLIDLSLGSGCSYYWLWLSRILNDLLRILLIVVGRHWFACGRLNLSTVDFGLNWLVCFDLLLGLSWLNLVLTSDESTSRLGQKLIYRLSLVNA
jgi:hypothetical protein